MCTSVVMQGTWRSRKALHDPSLHVIFHVLLHVIFYVISHYSYISQYTPIYRFLSPYTLNTNYSIAILHSLNGLQEAAEALKSFCPFPGNPTSCLVD